MVIIYSVPLLSREPLLESGDWSIDSVIMIAPRWLWLRMLNLYLYVRQFNIQNACRTNKQSFFKHGLLLKISLRIHSTSNCLHLTPPYFLGVLFKGEIQAMNPKHWIDVRKVTDRCFKGTWFQIDFLPKGYIPFGAQKAILSSARISRDNYNVTKYPKYSTV